MIQKRKPFHATERCRDCACCLIDRAKETPVAPSEEIILAPCALNPPQFVPAGGQLATALPEVNVDVHWCGQFRPRVRM